MAKHCRLTTRPHRWFSVEILEESPVCIVKVLKPRPGKEDQHLLRYPLVLSPGQGCEQGFDELHPGNRKPPDTRFTRSQKSARKTPVQKNSAGVPLCRWCSQEIKPPKRTFCGNLDCVHQWKIRTQTSYVRKCCFKRDAGKCQLCGVKNKKLWQADHIIPVSLGGGLCGLDNYRTLCLLCHKECTAELKKTLQANLVQAREQERARCPTLLPAAPTKKTRKSTTSKKDKVQTPVAL